ncbi:sensor histidine kinase [Paenibacillus sp. y28]|uniref:sensor histidine kinase n=1 Tax=Paenibacillus sp. y28 TaxID=3129110 RepID=UPI003015CC5D
MEIDAIDKVIKNAINVMETSKYQIFEICESARSEWEALNRELQHVIEETNQTIELVDKLEMDYRRARVKLTEVSRDFHRFKEEDIRVAYEAATNIQLQLSIFKEKEIHLRSRRDDLQKRLKNLDKTIERAEALVIQMNLVLEYLSGDLNQVTRILESAKNRQMLGFKIILAQEEERKRIAREIHDGMAQSLAHVVVRAEIAERMIVKQEFEAVRMELSELKQQVRSGLEEVRKIIFNLRPMALDDLGLVPTLRKFIQDYEERTKIRTHFELMGREERLPSAMEVAVFRLVQEAFSNVYKHAEASFVSVELAYLKRRAKIVVTDNGIGFAVDRVESDGNHFGLMGMRERIELLEGTMEIYSQPHAGTRITIVIPFGAEREEAKGQT